MITILPAGDIDLYQKYFFQTKRGTFKVLFDENYFDDPRSLLRNYIIYTKDDIIIGILSYLENFFQYKDSIHLEMIEVAKEYRYQGISKELLNSLFCVCRGSSKPISISPYTEDGRKYIRSYIIQFVNKQEQ